eukprot:5671300-Amphidinium_carterae.1
MQGNEVEDHLRLCVKPVLASCSEIVEENAARLKARPDVRVALQPEPTTTAKKTRAVLHCGKASELLRNARLNSWERTRTNTSAVNALCEKKFTC